MKKFNVKKFIIVTLLVAIALVSVMALLFGTNKTYSAYANVYVPDGDEVSVYVSGNDVKKSEDGKNYIANPGTEITVTVVNERKLFSSMKINDTTYVDAVAKLTVPASGNLTITVETVEPYADDTGKYFGNPYVLSKEADILSVSRILAGTSTEDDFKRIGAEDKTAEEIAHGYFKLGTNVFINSDEFFGLGFRGKYAFSGCFDFNGYTATINITRTEHRQEEFHFMTASTHTADYGFFAYVYGTDNKPCLIKNAKVQGFIGINTMHNVDNIDHSDHVNAGGIAGTLGKDVVLDGLESSVSVSAQTRFASLYLGGVFGICSSSVDNWCDVEYDGSFNDISAVTNGTGADAIVGCFAGVLQNASVDGLTIDGERALVLANSLGSVSGSAIAGGFVGVIELGAHTYPEISEPRAIVIRNVNIIAERDYSVTSVIHNNESTGKALINPDDYKVNSAAAISGGIIGIVNRGRKGTTTLPDNINITFSAIKFSRADALGVSDDEDKISNNSRLTIKSSTLDASSSGAVYAGGAVGYIYSGGAENVMKELEDGVDVEYVFNCPLDVSAVQNGVGPAYAGGVFGYNCFNFKGGTDKSIKLAVTKPEFDYTVTAVQTATSTSVNSSSGTTVSYNVCAGGYTPRLNIAYSISSGAFYVSSGKIRAYREVGSTAVGDVNAGGFAARALSTSSAINRISGYNGTVNGEISDLTVYFTDSSYVEAACYSFSSIDSTAQNELGNNVCVGGAIGYLIGYKSVKNVSVLYEDSAQGTKDTAYFVYGAQNAKNSNADNDLKSEGFVGGVFGLVADTQLYNINIKGNEEENSVVYFESANSPNTASVGGLVGALWLRKTNRSTYLDTASVSYIHTAGKAYSSLQTANDIYDIYVGGAIGVFANPTGGTISVTNITVNRCDIDAVGENKMLTYAGGIIAGMWWSANTKLSYGIITDSAVTATSITAKAYAGGTVGLMQRSQLSYCLTKDTDVKAVSEQNVAYVAGIAARVKTGDGSYSLTSSYSNASLNVQGKSGSGKYGIAAMPDNNDSSSSKNFFVSEPAGTKYAYTASGTSASTGNALYLTEDGNELTINKLGDTAVIYPSLPNRNYPIPIWSNDEEVMTVVSSATSSYTAKGIKEGVAYAGLYCTINNVDYLLCSYPIIVVNSDETGDFNLSITDFNGGNTVDESNSDAYKEITSGGETYAYFRRNIGNPDTVKQVIVSPKGSKYLPTDVRFYDITGLTAATYEDDISARINAILAQKAKTAACDISAFNGRANVGYNYADIGEHQHAKSSVYFYANDNVRENTIIVVEVSYGDKSYGVIVEFVPNRLISLEIAPESSTPPLDYYIGDDGITHYIYTAGDVVRFTATLGYRYKAPRSYIVETIYEGTGVTENGTVIVASGQTYTITCRDLKKTLSAVAVIEARDEVDYSFAYLGADGSSDRKMVQGCEFIFNISPQPGYGLKPTTRITVGGETVIAVADKGILKVAFSSGSFDFVYVEDAYEANSYAITVPSEFVDYAAANGGVLFDIEYDKVYSLVFIANYGENVYFSTTVAAGEKFADVKPEGFDEWTNARIAERYGYDFRGYYTLNKASDIAAYGKSFEDMQKDGVSTVSGTMRFYARWTYNITVDAPEGVDVISSMTPSMLADGTIVPIDAYVGFGFVMKTGKTWQGTPRYDAYIRCEDGTFEKITDLFGEASQENGYFVSAADIEKFGSGHIYVKVYADSLEFAVGDAPQYDGNAIYSDGIYTLTYNVNYGADDTVSDVNFDFDKSMPKGTTARLFYLKDGVTIWSGNYELPEAASRISLASFASMGDGSALTYETRKNAVSEKFIVVITLPNNTNAFNATDAFAVKVNVAAYAYKSVIEFYGKLAPTIDDTAALEGDVTEFNVYPAVIRGVTVSEENKTLTFVENGKANAEVIDRRHNGSYYMWRIEKVGGGYVGTEKFDAFGTEIVRATDAVYYVATLNESVSFDGIAGYKISLIEAKNPMQPAVAIALFEKVL